MIDNKTAPYGALILRVAMGVLFLAHAALKIFVFTPAGTVKYFGMLGLPASVAYFMIILEVVGGVALILGVYARWFAIPLAGDLIGAIVLVHFHNGWLFTNKGGGWEYPAFWAVALIALLLLGDGAWALAPSNFGGRRRG